ncbi:hypothetical protein GJ744_008421 [Endocarpon pusillum]|uniref:Uncharacterized protein n=1 Tax=Endocarpon pusillum TaxID=364733 RepID=A0A8H7AL03_9EURO|nr:hypothetical protein GJ744_008421 [Endocarpon pusillum]
MSVLCNSRMLPTIESVVLSIEFEDLVISKLPNNNFVQVLSRRTSGSTPNIKLPVQWSELAATDRRVFSCRCCGEVTQPGTIGWTINDDEKRYPAGRQQHRFGILGS